MRGPERRAPRRLARALLGVAAAALDARAALAQEGPSFGVPLVAEVHQDAYADFLARVAERDWSRAFRSIGEEMEHPPAGLLPARDGIALSFRERLWRDLVELDPDGRRAFRLYYDARAERLWRAAERASEEQRPGLWRELFERWFPTRFGDQAADALARRASAAGDARAAALLWRAVLDHHPDTDLDKRDLWLDLCASLAASENWEELARAAEHVAARYAGTTVEREGVTQDVGTWLAGLERRRVAAPGAPGARPAPPTRSAAGALPAPPTGSTAGALPAPPTGSTAGALPAPPPRSTAGALPARLPLAQEPVALWRFELPSPAARADALGPPQPAGLLHDGGLLLDQAGVVRRIEPATGALAWTQGSDPERADASELRGRNLLARAGEWIVASDTPSWQGERVLLRLALLEPGTGDRLWSSEPLGEGVSLLGTPLVHRSSLYVVGQVPQSFTLELWCLDLADGRARWHVPLGTPGPSVAEQGATWRGSTTTLLPIRPELALDGEELYVATDAGALLAVAPEDGSIRWAWLSSLERGSVGAISPASLHLAGGVLYLRGRGSPRCVALDLSARRELWSAAVSPDERIVAADERNLYLVGTNARALALATGERRWSRPVLVPADVRAVVQTEAYLYLLTRRGLYELDKASGDSGRPPLRGDLVGLDGGDVLCDGERLLCIGARAVLAIGLER